MKRAIANRSAPPSIPPHRGGAGGPPPPGGSWAGRRLRSWWRRRKDQKRSRPPGGELGGGPRRASYFDAARRDRTFWDFLGPTHTVDGAYLPVADFIVGRMRALVHNNPWARSARAAYQRNVVGKAGIRVKPAARDDAGEPLEEFNARALDLWEAWAEDPRRCHVEQRLSFPELQRQVIGQMFEAGEIFAREVITRADFTVPLQLQLLEVESLAVDAQQPATAGNEIRRGIEVDGRQCPRWYHFLGTARGDATSDFSAAVVKVPARKILHLFVQERPGQSHGLPWAHAVITALRQLEEVDEWTVEATRIQATIALIVNRSFPGGAGDLGVGLDQTAREADRRPGLGDDSLLEPGLIWTGAPGDEVTALRPTQPNTEYANFVTAQGRNIAAGMDLSQATLNRDYSQGSFSSLRQGMIEDQRIYAFLQYLLAVQLVRPVYRWFVETAIYAGYLEAPDFADRPERYLRADCLMPGWDWIDPLKHAQALKILYEAGLMSGQEICGARGADWETVQRQRLREARIRQQTAEVRDPLEPDAESVEAARAIITRLEREGFFTKGNGRGRRMGVAP